MWSSSRHFIFERRYERFIDDKIVSLVDETTLLLVLLLLSRSLETSAVIVR